MNVEESLKCFSLVPPDDALPQIRALLAQEADAERNGAGREEDLALLCCVQLFSRGDTEDILRIWDAKQSGFDLGCYLDVQFLCGAGLEQTKAFLSNAAGPAAAQALAYIEKCEGTGDFKDFSPATHLAQYRQYFGAT